jgi:hypothetical protein
MIQSREIKEPEKNIFKEQQGGSTLRRQIDDMDLEINHVTNRKVNQVPILNAENDGIHSARSL